MVQEVQALIVVLQFDLEEKQCAFFSFIGIIDDSLPLVDTELNCSVDLPERDTKEWLSDIDLDVAIGNKLTKNWFILEVVEH